MHVPIVELLKAILKGLAYVAENFPDNPRLGRRLLIGGGLLLSTLFLPVNSPDWGDFLSVLVPLCTITGGVCVVLGTFVFFRRWVWRRQEKRTPVITSLRLK
jgi:hypothetical protein